MVMSEGEQPDADLIAAVHDATAEAYRATVLRSGGHEVDIAGLSCFVGTTPSPFIVNTAVRSGRVASAEEALRAAWATYASVGHAFLLMASDGSDRDLEAAAEETGWRMVLEMPVMVSRGALPDAPPAPGVVLRRADPLADLEAFRDVAVAGFATDADEVAAVQSVFSRPASLEPADTAAFVASVDGVDAAAALVFVTQGIGIVEWVATAAAFRRRGLGAAVTRAATNAGFERGAAIVALQASPMGKSVYADLGFEVISSDRLWFPPAA